MSDTAPVVLSKSGKKLPVMKHRDGRCVICYCANLSSLGTVIPPPDDGIAALREVVEDDGLDAGRVELYKSFPSREVELDGDIVNVRVHVGFWVVPDDA
jgi:hypothetical protein